MCVVQRSCSLTPCDGPQRLEGSPSPHAQWWPQPRQLHTYTGLRAAAPPLGALSLLQDGGWGRG